MSAPIPQAAFQSGTTARKRVSPRRFSQAENNLIAELYAQGVRPAQIAARFGVRADTIKNKIKLWGEGSATSEPRADALVLPFPPSSLSGHANGNSYHAKAGVTKRWRETTRVAAAAYCRGLDLGDGDILVSVRFVPADRRGDRVNFPNRMKPIFDGIADALGVNDSRFVPAYTFAAPEKPGRIEITIAKEKSNDSAE
jgi:crossover junction endodeoxyribonuclease RusA